jgi:tRNA pseudouridine synthase 10
MMIQKKSKIEKNTGIVQIISKAKQILKEFDLCEDCLGRLFAKNLSLTSHKLLGKRINKILNVKSTSKCYICKNILSNLELYMNKMFEIDKEYQYSTFLVGAKLQPSITDKDDIIRSKFGLRGIDSVKTDITKQIGKKFAKKTRKKIDYRLPDLTFTIDFKNNYCDVSVRPLIFYGRYQKKVRGIPQKQTRCHSCQGRGCFSCKFHGISEFNSVEGKISEFLFHKFGGTQAKITWIGGEDKTSLVLGNGRPFFVKLLNPNKRKLPLAKKYSVNKIIITHLRVLDQMPKDPIPFLSNISISVNTKKDMDVKDFKKIQDLKKIPLTISDKGYKKARKFVYKIQSKKNSSNSFSLKMTIDGGVPIKGLVEGKNVSPSISEILENQCVCKEFDFHGIKLLN